MLGIIPYKKYNATYDSHEPKMYSLKNAMCA